MKELVSEKESAMRQRRDNTFSIHLFLDETKIHVLKSTSCFLTGGGIFQSIQI